MPAPPACGTVAVIVGPDRSREHNLDLHCGYADFRGVNLRNAGRTLSGLALGLALVGCASTSPRVVSMGDNTYSVTRQAGTVFQRDTEALTAKAKADAARFCAAQGKQLKVVDVVVEKPFPTTGYAKAKVIFQPVDMVGPAPASAPAPATVSEKPAPAEVAETPAPVAPVEAPAPAMVREEPAPPPVSEKPAPIVISEQPGGGDFYTDLLKLDDLRKRGILTEEEFQAEKKKILNRSK